MNSAIDVVETLCHRYAFGDVRALLPMIGLPSAELRRLRRICLFGQRLLELDAEDFDMADVEGGGPEYTALVDRARQSRMPQHPKEEPRGALSSMRPAYRLLLEVLQAQHFRHDMAGMVATIHMMSEYLPLLAWEDAWGHAADPARLEPHVAGAGSSFGDSHSVCGHHRTDRSAAGRAQRIALAPAEGWQTYLDRQHSHVAHALAVCAAECRNQCTVLTRLPTRQQDPLTERCTVALAFDDSAIVKLRHAAPVGHGFGVPSEPEIDEAWEHTRTVLSKRGPYAEPVMTEDGYCLAGLPSLLSSLAGVTLRADTLLKDTSLLLVDKLHHAFRATA